MPGIMKELFIQDFLEAREGEKQIRTGMINNQLPISDAARLFNDKIGYIRRDVSNMDTDAWHKYEEKLKELDIRCLENKNKFKATYEEEDDPIGEDNYYQNLAWEDMKRLSAELKFVQRLAYDKGWLE